MNKKKKKPPLRFFLECQINPSAFPICLSLKISQWARSQTGVIKKPSTKQRISRDCQGQPNLDPRTNPMGGLPPSLPLALFQGGWNMCNMVGGWWRWGHQSHATMHVQMHPDSIAHVFIHTTFFFGQWHIYNPTCCEVRKQIHSEKRSSGTTHKSSAKKYKRATFCCWHREKNKRRKGLFLRTLCKCTLQPSCHSRSAKWIILKVREKCLVPLSNCSSPKPICLPVTVALGD